VRKAAATVSRLSKDTGAGEHPQDVGNGARRSRRFDVARSTALAEYSKFLGLLTPKRPESRAPRCRQLVNALRAPAPVKFAMTETGRLVISDTTLNEQNAQMLFPMNRRFGEAFQERNPT
jgi:hypothetical protein